MIDIGNEDYASAAENCDKEIKVIREIVDQLQSNESFLKLAEANDKRASLYFFENDDQNAMDRINYALKLYRFLERNVSLPEMKLHLAQYYEKLGGFFAAAENYPAAIDHYGQSADMYTKLFEQEPSETACCGLGRVSVKLADLLAPDESMYDSLHLAEYAFSRLVRLCPDNEEYRSHLEDVRKKMS